MAKTSFGNPAMCQALAPFAVQQEPISFKMKHTAAVKEFCQTLRMAQKQSNTRKINYG